MKVRVRDNALELLVQWWAANPERRRAWFATDEVSSAYIEWLKLVQGMELELVELPFRDSVQVVVEYGGIRYGIMRILAIELTLWYRLKRCLSRYI